MKDENTMILGNTKVRILQYLEYKGISKPQFYTEMGIKRGLLDSDKMNATVTDTVIAKILVAYKDIDPLWFITGEGKMLKEASSSPPLSEREAVFKELFVQKEKELSDLRTEKDCDIKKLERKVWELEQELQVFTSRKKTVQGLEGAAGAADIMDGMVG